MKNSKLKFLKQRLNSYYDSILVNRGRLWLTIIGLTIGIILLLGSFLAMDNLKMSFLEDFKVFNDNVILIEKDNSFSIEEIRELNDYIGSTNKITYSTPLDLKQVHRDVDNKIVSNYIIQGVTDGFYNNHNIDGVIENSGFEKNQNLYKSNLISKNQNLFDNFDSTYNGIVINEFGAKFLFQEEDPIGKMIKLPSDENGQYFIMGVVSNSDDVTNKINVYNKSKSKLNETNIDMLMPNIHIYLNNSSYKNYYQSKKILYTNLVVTAANKNEYYKINVGLASYYSGMFSEKLKMTTINTIIDDAEKVQSEYKIPLYLGVGFITLISGLSMMNTLFFNVKEKFSEIGIRLSLGAKRKDIRNQFLFEGILYAFLAMIISVVLVVLISKVYVIHKYLTTYEYIKIYYDVKIILIVLALVVFQTIIFSMIPSRKASKMKIIDSIKFE